MIAKILDFYKKGLKILKAEVIKLLLGLQDRLHLKIEKKYLQISQLPESERERVLSVKLIELQGENEKLKAELEKLKSALDEKRKKKLAEVIKKVAEAEKADEPVSLVNIITKLRAAGILRFLRPVYVLGPDHKILGKFVDIEFYNGGFRIVFEDQNKTIRHTPIYHSFDEAFVDIDHIHHQLKAGVLVVNAIEQEGELVKLDPSIINQYYKGLNAKDVIAYYHKQLQNLSKKAYMSELEKEFAVIRNIQESLDAEESKLLAKTTLNLYEDLKNTVSRLITPSALSAIHNQDILWMQLARERGIAEGAVDQAQRVASRLKTLEQSTAPERIILAEQATQDRLRKVIDELTQILERLSNAGYTETGSKE